jgi:hypothetical protein
MNSPLRHSQSTLKSKAPVRSRTASDEIAISLTAAIVALHGDEPVVAVHPAATSDGAGEWALPCGLFSPRAHQTLEAGLRFWVGRQTGLELKSTQQLCAFAGRRTGRRDVGRDFAAPYSVSICYLGLVGPDQCHERNGVSWRSWYSYFPWEDWRQGKPECLTNEIEPRLAAWAQSSCVPSGGRKGADKKLRVRMCFGLDGASWDEE